MRRTLPFVLLTALIISLFSCSGGDEPKKEQFSYDRADSLPVEYLRELGTIRVSIEETAQLNKQLKNNGYSYNSSFLTSAGSASGYSNSKMQALGLGAYGSDLNYAVSFEQTQDALNYIKSIVQLSDKLGIKGAFDEELLSKLAEPDSSVNKSILLTKAYLQAEDQMYAEDRAKLATLMVTGGWIEGMYIAASHLKEKNSGKVSTNLWNLSYSYNNVVKMLEVFKESSEIAEVIEEINKAAGPVNKIVKAKNNISPKHIEELYTVINALREEVL